MNNISSFQFYNSEAVCSELIDFNDVALDNRSYSDVDFTTTFNFTVSTNLVWCLREEPLEIQVSALNFTCTFNFTFIFNFLAVYFQLHALSI